MANVTKRSDSNSKAEKLRIDMQSSNKRFNEIVNKVKEQGGSVSAFIIESVIFRENYLKMNREEISPQLDVNEYSEFVPIKQEKAPINVYNREEDTTSREEDKEQYTTSQATREEDKKENKEEDIIFDGLEAVENTDSFFDDEDDLDD